MKYEEAITLAGPGNFRISTPEGGKSENVQMALMAHCYNHFPKLLGALRDVIDNCDALVSAGLAKTYPAGYGTYIDILEQASEVEGI